MSAWDRMRAQIESGHAGRTAVRVLTLTEEERREVADALPGYLRETRNGADWRILDRRLVEPLRVAGAGCIAGAAAAAAWLCRADLRTWANEDAASPVAQAVAERPAEWRIDVARRISGRLRPTNLPWRDGSNWRLAARLLRDAGAEPPPDDAFVLGWIQCGTGSVGLREDPFLGALVGRLFEADGVGRALAWDNDQSAHTWKGELVALSTDGRIDRPALLDGCLSRFLRGGRANDLRWFVGLHDGLEPTLEEVTARTRDYLRLLPSAPGPVAEVALRELRRADEAGGLDEAAFTEAAEAVLFRPEKKLVRAALTWLDRTARTRADATLSALTVAFGHEALDLRQRAVKVVARHAAHASAETLSAVRDAAASLPSDLRERIASACGGVVVADDLVPEPVVLAPVPVPELAPPIASAAELAEEVSALLRTAKLGWAEAERVLSGLVTLTYQDRDAVHDALKRVVDPHSWLMTRDLTVDDDPQFWFGAALAAAMNPPARRPRLSGMLSRAREGLRSPSVDHFAAPQRVMFRRVREAIGAIGTAPLLLSTPTSGSGHLAPDVLVSRLETLEAAGVEAGQADLEQALLRLPREADHDAAARARRLSSTASWVAAQRLADGGACDPVVTCVPVTLKKWAYAYGPGYERKQVDVVHLLAEVTAGEMWGATAAELCRLPGDGGWRSDHHLYYYRAFGWWPAVLPSHREVTAAHLLPMATAWVDERAGQGAAILGLAEGSGPLGDATATLLTYGLGARHQEERSGAVDALLVLAGRSEVPAAEIGTAIATLVRHKLVKLNRVTAGLGDAADAGAYADVWSVISSALPELLPDAGSAAPAGLPDLIAVGARSVEAIGARTGVTRLADVAARGGSSRLVQEAGRLHRLITTT